MNCIPDWCEFYNIIFGGLIIGIIASFLFIGITDIISICRFIKRYKYLKSFKKDHNDWIAYSMREDNGRMIQDLPNGSTANINIKKKRIYITLVEKEGRKWYGELQMERFGFGILTLKYDGDHEYGKRECIIGSYEENGKMIDYIFMIPTINTIYYIKNIDADKQGVVYNYGNEILTRERSVPNKGFT